mgnify:CR=1 FL=1
MVANNSYPKMSKSQEDPWLIWFTFFSSILIYISLFVISASLWHLSIIITTLLILWGTSPSPFKTLGFIFSLVLFLATLQIIFSPYMRSLLMKSLEEGFTWTDWQYLLFAVERFAWPLAIVSSFQTRLRNPATIAHLTMLLKPLEWFGLQVGKLQTLVVLALRFMPSLKLEWERFSKFQTFFVLGTPRKTYTKKLKFWLSVLKALISHTIHRAMTLGDLLAIRGLPSISSAPASKYMLLLSSGWLGLGVLFISVDTTMAMIWSLMSLWLGLVSIAQRRKATA